jgi:mRNA interferase HigB
MCAPPFGTPIQWGRARFFNIKGNDYRLITRISYTRQRVYVRDVLTHAEYDKGKWKDDYKS